MHGLQQGNEVLKEIHKELNVEAVERILDETAEAREYQRVRSHVNARIVCLQECRKLMTCLRTRSPLKTKKLSRQSSASLKPKPYAYPLTPLPLYH